MRFAGNDTKLVKYAWPVIVSSVMDQAGKAQAVPGSLKLLQDGIYHIVGCSSPEYKCYPPFQSRMCSTKQDCNYDLSQLRWGLQTALELAEEFPELAADLKERGIDARWWQALLAGKLAWYPYDDATGFRLDANCTFGSRIAHPRQSCQCARAFVLCFRILHSPLAILLLLPSPCLRRCIRVPTPALLAPVTGV